MTDWAVAAARNNENDARSFMMPFESKFRQGAKRYWEEHAARM